MPTKQKKNRAGSFKRPLFADDDETRCVGVETEDGTHYWADKVVLAAGAWSPTLVDLEDQCCSKVRRIPFYTLVHGYTHQVLTLQ